MLAHSPAPVGAAQPLELKPDGPAGDAASSAALSRLKRSLAQSHRRSQGAKKLHKAIVLMKAAVAAIEKRDYLSAAQCALDALQVDETNGLAWHILAIARDKAGDAAQAIAAYEAALKLLPDESAIAADLGRLAQRLGYLEIADKLFLKHLAKHPGNLESTNNLACVQRDQGRYGDAIETLKALLALTPDEPMLWNTLGSVLSDRGDMVQSLVFFDEALRLDSGFSKALYNRANVRMALGEVHESLIDIDAAMSQVDEPIEIETMRMAKSMTQMFVGQLEDGFENYEARLSPHLENSVRFVTDCLRLEQGAELAGRHLLVIGEQGLGDEVLFANVLPDLIAALGPDGYMTLAVEHRLVPLMRRSFPGATVVPHRTARIEGRLTRVADRPEGAPPPDAWTPIASLFRRFRRTPDAFPATGCYLGPDPDRVAHWRGELALAGAGPKIGVVWKSLRLEGMRLRYFAPFDLWRPVLTTPGAVFVNLQYGDVAAEIETAKANGISLWTPPGIDLKDDLDDLAALTCALDLMVGPPNATVNIGAACGVPWWAFSTPDDWQRFGTDRFPCYPSTRIFPIEGFGEWEGAMARVGAALDGWVTERARGNAA
ncbi:tetratricopeptide repeat protein [Brevundimonas sp.]|uniref:tetratricopeptide repeat protein n=1 Tax=Brevundimonas sp. TaxID=1871086 RepID=UPI00356A2C84